MKHSIQLLSIICLLGYTHASIEKWTEYRLAEMFSIPSQSEHLSEFFTSEAYDAYEKSLTSALSDSNNDEYHVTLNKFLSPVKITDAEEGKYAQASFILNISNTRASWQLPMEMILTINTDNGYKITHFEGITANPINQKHYQQERNSHCNQ
jgi:hypothetical protein